ncbi:MAG: DUF4433 domain-containing protein [Bacteroidota bacterium]
MKPSDVEELCYITPIDNLQSIFHHGILSHNRSKKLKTKSVADPDIQARREKVIVPGTNRKLHDFANLYFNPRNPMMYKRKALHANLCVLRILCNILDEKGVIITDGNASSNRTLFQDPQQGFALLDEKLIYAKYWHDDNPIEKDRKTWSICAEVLVPDVINVKFIQGIYVSCVDTEQKVLHIIGSNPIAKNVQVLSDLFFL